LAARLVELAERYGDTTEAGIVVRVPMSQAELAAWTGASRAGFSKALQSLRDLGWVELARGRLLVRDLAALRARWGQVSHLP
jgi:CRP-like cAMP-binding protein